MNKATIILYYAFCILITQTIMHKYQIIIYDKDKEQSV